ncbi:hypothetical protein [Fischerella thermalis]|nr:hypothetical protein [Fischerella thermalis]
MLRCWALVFPITNYPLPITNYQPTRQYEYSSEHDMKLFSTQKGFFMEQQ